jgi:hypothetical protein
VDEQDGGGKLPGAFEFRGISEVEVAEAICADGNIFPLDGGDQVEDAALQEVGEEGVEERLPEAGVLEVMVAIIVVLFICLKYHYYN